MTRNQTAILGTFPLNVMECSPFVKRPGTGGCSCVVIPGYSTMAICVASFFSTEPTTGLTYLSILDEYSSGKLYITQEIA